MVKATIDIDKHSIACLDHEDPVTLRGEETLSWGYIFT